MVVLFDLNGTLTNPAAIGEAWGAPDIGPEVLATAVQSAMTDTVLGQYREFSRHLRSAIEVVAARRQLDAGRIEVAVERASRLPPYPDAEDALGRLNDAGRRLAVLTNSGAEGGRATLEAAGLSDHFHEILGVDAVRRFKPHPSTYAHAVSALGTNPAEIVMVAAHAWDVRGAAHAGMRTGWIGRGEEAFPKLAPEPTFTARDLSGAASMILDRHLQ